MYDFINKFIRKINWIIHVLILFKLTTLFEVIYLNLIGVKKGRNIKFNGWTSVFKSNNSIISIGDGCVFNSNTYTNHIGINHNCIITTMLPKSQLMIGNNCGFSGCSITAFKKITIGNNVRVGANCVIADGDFHLDDKRTPLPKPITIEDNVWIGYGVIIMKGVKIGENSIIGLHSVVTKDIPANCIAVGNPCAVKKFIN